MDLSSVSGGAVGSPGRTTVTITDDDAAPALSISNVTQYEGNSGTANATFTVSLSAVSGQTVQVAYASANGTATAGTDYQAVAGTLSIPAGASSGVMAVPVYGDGAFEANETFVVNLTAPVNASLAGGQGLGTLLNDDAARITWGDVYAPRDGSADAALLTPGTGLWTVKDSHTGTVATAGPVSDVQAADVPVPADYTGDGITDCALYRPATGRWTVAPACLPSGQYSVAACSADALPARPTIEDQMDANPTAGLVVGLLFLIVGIIAVRVPDRVQEMARASNRNRPWTKLFFSGFVKHPSYVPGMRLMGWVFILAGAFVWLGSTLALVGILK